MKLLLDTHIYIWLTLSPDQLSAVVREALANPENELLFSVASLWEATIKSAKGKLTPPEQSVQGLINRLDQFQISVLSI